MYNVTLFVYVIIPPLMLGVCIGLVASTIWYLRSGLMDTEVRLNELDKVEWFDVARQFMPELTQERFDVMWDEFQELKRKRGMQ